MFTVPLGDGITNVVIDGDTNGVLDTWGSTPVPLGAPLDVASFVPPALVPSLAVAQAGQTILRASGPA